MNKLETLLGINVDFIIAILSIYSTLFLGYRLHPDTITWFMLAYFGSITARINVIKKIIYKEVRNEYLALLISYPIAFLTTMLSGIALQMYFQVFSMDMLLHNLVISVVMVTVMYFISIISNYIEKSTGNMRFLVYPVLILFISTILVFIDIWLE